ncbi:hypothetical protein CsSME_00036277 [Camellia sinensis var. sinensis]
MTKVSIRNFQYDEQVVVVDQFQLVLSYLHDSLIQEIVLRLPLKLLSQISEPLFSRLYVSQKINSQCLSPFQLLFRYIYVSHFQKINFSMLFLSTAHEHKNGDQYKILAASKGLLLCCLLALLTYFVCDPFIFRIDNRPIFIGEGLIALANEDNVVTSYKVIHTYSLESGEWNDFKVSCFQPVKLFKRGNPFLFNGEMHWFTYGNQVVAFDPYNIEECRYNGSYRLCEECQGMLRYFEAAPDIAEDFYFSMWNMKDYGRKEWSLVH